MVISATLNEMIVKLFLPLQELAGHLCEVDERYNRPACRSQHETSSNKLSFEIVIFNTGREPKGLYAAAALVGGENPWHVDEKGQMAETRSPTVKRLDVKG